MGSHNALSGVIDTSQASESAIGPRGSAQRRAERILRRSRANHRDFLLERVDRDVFGDASAVVERVIIGRRSPRSECPIRMPSRLSRVASCFALRMYPIAVRR